MSHDAILIDIGRSDCRISLMQRSATGRPRFAHNVELNTADFPTLDKAIEYYLSVTGLSSLPPAVGIAVMGIVRGRRTTRSAGPPGHSPKRSCNRSTNSKPSFSLTMSPPSPRRCRGCRARKSSRSSSNRGARRPSSTADATPSCIRTKGWASPLSRIRSTAMNSSTPKRPYRLCAADADGD